RILDSASPADTSVIPILFEGHASLVPRHLIGYRLKRLPMSCAIRVAGDPTQSRQVSVECIREVLNLLLLRDGIREIDRGCDPMIYVVLEISLEFDPTLVVIRELISVFDLIWITSLLDQTMRRSINQVLILPLVVRIQKPALVCYTEDRLSARGGFADDPDRTIRSDCPRLDRCA